MNLFSIDFWLLLISVILSIILLVYLSRNKKSSQLHSIFIIDLLLTLIISVGVLIQSISYNIFEFNPMFFENFIYIGTCFLPVSLFFTGLIFANTKITFKKWYYLLFVVPLLSLLILWTNDLHQLFYKYYSSNINECIYGSYIVIHHFYSYIMMIIGMLYLLRYSIKNSGFFSKQSILMLIGISIPLSINILGSLQIVPMSIYMTPITFTVAILFIALAIFKFDFLKVTPIALQRVVDRMSDGYIIVNDENIVTDFNQTFLELFSLKTSELRNININDLISKLSNNSEKRHTFLDAINKTKSDDTTIKIESYFSRVK